jgi:2-hydroxy-3-keto-5-methylthiopentenyl-1-phosphate phosphatase
MIIAVDFDGTLCENDWPEIGKANINLINNLKLCKNNYGDKVILWTCRTGELLDDAVKWCEEHGLIFDTVNENLPEVIEEMGGDTRKIFADVYIDDKALGENTGYWYKRNYLVTLNQQRMEK